MANNVKSICPEPGCGAITSGGRCPEHSRQKDRARERQRSGSPSRAVYNDRRWHVCRTFVLERDKGICQIRERGCLIEATIADHFNPTLDEILALGLNPFDPDHCRAACAKCSGRVDGRRAHRGGGHHARLSAIPAHSPSSLL